MPLDCKQVTYAGSDSPTTVLLSPNKRTKETFEAVWMTTGNVRSIQTLPITATTIYVFSMAYARITKASNEAEEILSCVEGIQIPCAFTSIGMLLPIKGSLEINEYTQVYSVQDQDKATILGWAQSGILKQAALEISAFANANRALCTTTPIKEMLVENIAAKNLQTFTTMEGSFSLPSYDKCPPKLPISTFTDSRGYLKFGIKGKEADAFAWDPFIKEGNPTGCIVSPGRKLTENLSIYGMLIFSFWLSNSQILNDARTKHCLRWELTCTNPEISGLVSRTNVCVNNKIPSIRLEDYPSASKGDIMANKDKVDVSPYVPTKVDGQHSLNGHPGQQKIGKQDGRQNKNGKRKKPYRPQKE